MRYLILFALVIFIVMMAGCNDDGKPIKIEIDPPTDWQVAPKVYKCTPEQMARVHSETQWCSDNTSYFKSYCYGTAFMRNCTKDTQ